MNTGPIISKGRLVRLWLPLWFTWLMMAAEGPYLAAVIARLPDAKYNLAAYGVAFAFAILVEAPVIMMMSAATALVDGAASYRRLRNFTFALNTLLTATLVAMLATPFFAWFTEGVMGLDPEVAHRTWVALWFMLPWPAAIGYRRFYQGIMIRAGLTRRVAYGTGFRLVTMSVSALVLARATDLAGATIGALALSIAVCAEAVISQAMAGSAVRALTDENRADPAVARAEGSSPKTASGYFEIWRFYYPLALTSTIALAAHPIVTFFLGQARAAIESLAVVPVINGLVFLFRTQGLSYQEVAISVMDGNPENRPRAARFAVALGVLASAGLALIALTPLSRVWLVNVSGLTPELAAYAELPLRILVPLPALSVLLSWQRSIVILSRRTGAITAAAIVEVAGIVAVLMLALRGFDLVGVTAAALAFLAGRLAGNATLIPACRQTRPISAGGPTESAHDDGGEDHGR